MTKEDLKGLMREYFLCNGDLESVIQFVHDLLNLKANNLKESEPYATVAIQELENAAYEVWRLLDDIEEAMEDDENEG